MPNRKHRTEFPNPGTILTRSFRGKIFQATVVSINQDIGTVAVDLDGKSYGTLSAAAKSITKYPVNGWMFWGLDTKIVHRAGMAHPVE